MCFDALTGKVSGALPVFLTYIFFNISNDSALRSFNNKNLGVSQIMKALTNKPNRGAVDDIIKNIFHEFKTIQESKMINLIFVGIRNAATTVTRINELT